MRNRLQQQPSLVEPQIKHEHAKELHQIALLLADDPELFDLVHYVVHARTVARKSRPGPEIDRRPFKIPVIIPDLYRGPRKEGTGQKSET